MGKLNRWGARKGIGNCTLSGVLALVSCGIGLSICRQAQAAHLRVVDSSGLVRAVKVVRTGARVVITIVKTPLSPAPSRGECVAVNIDGLATERHVQIDTKGECSFKNMTEGSWQIAVPQDAAWRVQVYDE